MIKTSLDMDWMEAAVREAKQPEAQGRRISTIDVLRKNIGEVERGELLADKEKLILWLDELQEFRR